MDSSKEPAPDERSEPTDDGATDDKATDDKTKDDKDAASVLDEQIRIINDAPNFVREMQERS